MRKATKTNFRQIRQQVIQCQPSNAYDDENTPNNPIYKPSFRGVKRINAQPLLTLNNNTPTLSPNNKVRLQRVESCKYGFESSSKKDCNKFSMLIDSLGQSGPTSSVQKKKNQMCVKNAFQNKKRDEKTIEQRCRQIKQKSYFTSRQNRNQLNSLSKLRNKLLSPLKVPQKPTENVKESKYQDHESIMSQHDFVNTSKAESINFDMSPCL